MPAALSRLSRLQLCHLSRYHTGGQASELPSGPWLSSLRWLSTDIGVLLRSKENLHAAAALECVSLAPSLDVVDWHSQAAAAFFDWLAHHLPLQRFSIEWSGSREPKLTVSKCFLAQLVQLSGRRPSLIVHCPGPDSEGQYFSDYVIAEYPF